MRKKNMLKKCVKIYIVLFVLIDLKFKKRGIESE